MTIAERIAAAEDSLLKTMARIRFAEENGDWGTAADQRLAARIIGREIDSLHLLSIRGIRR